MKYTNTTRIDLPLAVWLASPGGYDLTYDPNVISATSLLNPLKELVLTHRMYSTDVKSSQIDLDDVVASRLGTAVHDAAEHAWKDPELFRESMQALGHKDDTIDRFKVNPTVINDNDIPVYIEQRNSKEVLGMTISGKFDFVVDGTLVDLKTTKTYTWEKGTNNEKYQMQGSIYRWLNPDLVTSPIMVIQYAFTDWLPQYTKKPAYPNHRVMSKKFPLLPINHVQGFIEQKIQAYKNALDDDQGALPRCTPKELWQDVSEWAYHKNPQSDRATRLYPTQGDAYTHLQKDGNVGVVKERKAPVKYCKYCKARPICLQAEGYINEGLLKA